MRVDQQITRYKSRADYLAKKKAGVKASDQLVKDSTKKISDKTEISKEAKEQADAAKSKTTTPDTSKVTSGVSSTASASNSATSTVAKALKNIPTPKIDGTAPRELKEPEKFPNDLPKIINGPGIYFIKDMGLNPFGSKDGGLDKMAENIPTAKVFSWDQKDEIVDLVKRHNTNQPILLIGHGLGGDTAVEVVNELNDIEHGFRKVDLLVTLDSIGMNNDIIPQNVGQNLNIISDGDWFFNDGPNIARKTDRTNVVNELRSESHDELDDNADVQFQIFDKINIVLGDAVAQRNVEKNRIRQLFREQGIAGVHR